MTPCFNCLLCMQTSVYLPFRLTSNPDSPLSLSLNQRSGVQAEPQNHHLLARQTCHNALHPEGQGERGGGPPRCALAEGRCAAPVRRHQPVPSPHRRQQLDDHEHAQVGGRFVLCCAQASRFSHEIQKMRVHLSVKEATPGLKMPHLFPVPPLYPFTVLLLDCITTLTSSWCGAG